MSFKIQLLVNDQLIDVQILENWSLVEDKSNPFSPFHTANILFFYLR